MLRKSIIIILASLITVPAICFAKVQIAPYYQLKISEGSAISSRDGSALAIDLVNDLGMIVQPFDNHRFLGFYELKYSGPGLKRQEGEKFTDRLMDHIVIIRHHYKFLENYELKTQIDYMQEFKRTGTDEVMGKGLYDFKRTGLAVSAERKFNDTLNAEAQIQYHKLVFPNYTDLLGELQAGADAESTTGKQNHSNFEIGGKVKYDLYVFKTNFSMMSYEKQKVIVDTVQDDGTYYSDTLQKDTMISLGAEYERKLSERVALTPSLSIKMKGSNQNYQHFAMATSSVPVQYLAQYYDYNEIILAVPVAVVLSKKWDFFAAPEIDLKSYSKRPPRNKDNEFISGKQKNNLFLLSLGFTLKPNDITRTTFFYTFQNQTSNMEFEKYLPYNYSGHFVGISFNYTY